MKTFWKEQNMILCMNLISYCLKKCFSLFWHMFWLNKFLNTWFGLGIFFIWVFFPGNNTGLKSLCVVSNKKDENSGTVFLFIICHFKTIIWVLFQVHFVYALEMYQIHMMSINYLTHLGINLQCIKIPSHIKIACTIDKY